ncbi:MAG: murein tripeptide amidase MpaA, partial [Verrucomicrobiales bacterium]|nr:murein tripeptide amidase MpaA [Verrucomicrobiales bacterium]
LRCLDSLPESCAVVPCLNPDGVTLGTRGNANGVDLNRNFPTEDWQAEPVKYRWHVVEPEMTIPILTGDAPGSEPETQVLIELVEKLQPDLVIALHGPLACIDDPEKSPEARWIAEETGLPVVGDVGYPTPGSFGTWCAERDLPVITWEFPAESVEQISQSQVPTLVKILSGEWPFG